MRAGFPHSATSPADESSPLDLDGLQDLDDSPPDAPDWSPFGLLMPVLAGSSGAGASVLAAALTDALAERGNCSLLIDPAEPSSSGLAIAAPFDGSTTSTSGEPGPRARWSWRGQAVLAQFDYVAGSDGAFLPPELAPGGWLPPYSPLHATVVDLGSQWCRPAPGRHPLAGAATWLRTPPGDSTARPYPLLVVRPTRPSLLAAEGTLARYERWLQNGEMAGPAQLVVTACRKPDWPPGVVGAAGNRLAQLLDDAVFLPHDPDVERGGVTEAPTPPKLRRALARFLTHWRPASALGSPGTNRAAC